MVWPDIITKLRRAFHFRMAYGDVIPPEARVDPARFPEEKYPLYCPKCDYLLRGLREERCPECGHEFERGRLLVQQYVIEGGKRLSGRTYRYATRASIIGVLLVFVPPMLIALAAFLLSTAKNAPLSAMDWLMFAVRCSFVSACAGAFLMFVSTALFLRSAAITHKKSKAVSEGIDREVPAYRNVQRYKWIFLWGPFVIVAIFVWSCETDRIATAYRQYARSPEDLVPAVIIVAAVGLLIFVGRLLWRRWLAATDDDATQP